MSISSTGEESHTSSKSEEVSGTPNAQSTMEYVLALIESGHDTDGTMFNPDTDEEEYYSECDRAFDNEIIGAVLAHCRSSVGTN